MIKRNFYSKQAQKKIISSLEYDIEKLLVLSILETGMTLKELILWSKRGYSGIMLSNRLLKVITLGGLPVFNRSKIYRILKRLSNRIGFSVKPSHLRLTYIYNSYLKESDIIKLSKKLGIKPKTLVDCIVKFREV